MDFRKMFFLFADTQQIVHNCDVIKKLLSLGKTFDYGRQLS